MAKARSGENPSCQQMTSNIIHIKHIQVNYTKIGHIYIQKNNNKKVPQNTD